MENQAPKKIEEIAEALLGNTNSVSIPIQTVLKRIQISETELSDLIVEYQHNYDADKKYKFNNQTHAVDRPEDYILRIERMS